MPRAETQARNRPDLRPDVSRSDLRLDVCAEGGEFGRLWNKVGPHFATNGRMLPEFRPILATPCYKPAEVGQNVSHFWPQSEPSTPMAGMTSDRLAIHPIVLCTRVLLTPSAC